MPRTLRPYVRIKREASIHFVEGGLPMAISSTTLAERAGDWSDGLMRRKKAQRSKPNYLLGVPLTYKLRDSARF